MRVRVLNVAGEEARMGFQAAQLDRLGLAFERVEAVTPATLAPPPDDPSWDAWERPLRDVEKALYASHRRVWERVAGEAEPCLVLEDDAVLSDRVPALLDALAARAGFDHVTLEARGRRKLMARARHPELPVRRLWQDRTGAAAYVLWPSGAAHLLRRPVGLADAVICAAHGMESWQADPALAIQIDRCTAHGLAPPIPVRSAPLGEAKPSRSGYPLTARLGFRARRLAAQARMAGRALRRGAVRMAVPVAEDLEG